ncbi:MAG: MFS transporter [Isosphaeraceae bacterium]
MADGVRWRLAGMMALIYAVQGAWWPLLAIHLRDLGIEGRARGWMFATMALASLVTPLGAGQLADRLMPAQRLMALIYALGAGLLMLVASGQATSFVSLFALMMVYWLLMAPAGGLGGALALRNLERPAEQFGGVRLWGTVGWMASGWLASLVMALHGSSGAGQGTYDAFWIAAVLSATLAVFSLSLPHTPPLSVGTRGIDLREARALLRRPSVAVLLVTAFAVSLTTPFVYQVVPPYLTTLGLPRSRVAMAMSLGQILEVSMLVVLPWCLRRLGQRATLTLGIAAWVAYYAVLSAHPPLWVALLGIPLNGVAIALFHIAGPMYLDSQAPPNQRASVQCLYVMITAGVGNLLGNLLAGELVGRTGGVSASVFLVPCLVNLGLFLFFARSFHPECQTQTPNPERIDPPLVALDLS